MKKTLITLLALCGVAGAAEYTYTGSSTDWMDVAANWKDTSTNEAMTTTDTVYHNMTTANTQGNTFIVSSGTSAQAGKNCASFTGATLNIESNASVDIKGGSLNGTTINVAEGGSFQISASDCKMKDVTLNAASGTISIGKTWLDSNRNNGSFTFNLGDSAKVEYSEVVLNSNWGSTNTITLSANCLTGYVTGGGAITTNERTLVDFGTFNSSSTAGGFDYFLTSNRIVGSEITLNGAALTQASFDVNALTAEDVGKYQFVMDGSALKVQYVAYAIPEPTTATLSLLALAGLAARRRRK